MPEGYDSGATPVSLVAPSGCYFAGDDNLRLTAFNALASVALRISGRFLHLDGRVEPFVDRLVPTSDRVATVKTMHLGCGWLLSAQVTISTAAPLTGQTYGILSIVRGQSGGMEDLATLAAGYISAANRLAWPGSPVANSLESGGAIRSIAGTTPGAGAEISETVPTGARWELVSFAATFTASATVATRAPVLTIDDGTTVLMRLYCGTTITASQVWVLGWAQWALNLQEAIAKFAQVSLPIGMRLPAGARIRTLTAAMQAGDQWSAVQYSVREWLEGA